MQGHPVKRSVSVQASEQAQKILADREAIKEATRRVMLGNPRGDNFYSAGGSFNAASQYPSTTNPEIQTLNDDLYA